MKKYVINYPDIDTETLASLLESNGFVVIRLSRFQARLLVSLIKNSDNYSESLMETNMLRVYITVGYSMLILWKLILSRIRYPKLFYVIKFWKSAKPFTFVKNEIEKGVVDVKFYRSRGDWREAMSLRKT